MESLLWLSPFILALGYLVYAGSFRKRMVWIYLVLTTPVWLVLALLFFESMGTLGASTLSGFIVVCILLYYNEHIKYSEKYRNIACATGFELISILVLSMASLPLWLMVYAAVHVSVTGRV